MMSEEACFMGLYERFCIRVVWWSSFVIDEGRLVSRSMVDNVFANV